MALVAKGAMPELLRSNASIYHVTVGVVPGEDDLRVELSAVPSIEALEASGRRNLPSLGRVPWSSCSSRRNSLFAAYPTVDPLASATKGCVG